MPRSVHKTQKALFDKARKLEKEGKSIKFDTIISQKMVKGKRVGPRKTEYILIWK